MSDDPDDFSGDIDMDSLARLQEIAKMESHYRPELSHTEQAEEILKEASPAIAQGLVTIALSDPNSNTRLRASTYVLDRVLGKSGDGPTKQAPWESLFADVTDKASR